MAFGIRSTIAGKVSRPILRDEGLCPVVDLAQVVVRDLVEAREDLAALAYQLLSRAGRVETRLASIG
jgi:hypothetical protein